MTTLVKLQPVGYLVDLDTARIEVYPHWSTDSRSRANLPADQIMVQMFVDCLDDGRIWPCTLGVLTGTKRQKEQMSQTLWDRHAALRPTF